MWYRTTWWWSPQSWAVPGRRALCLQPLPRGVHVLWSEDLALWLISLRKKMNSDSEDIDKCIVSSLCQTPGEKAIKNIWHMDEKESVPNPWLCQRYSRGEPSVSLWGNLSTTATSTIPIYKVGLRPGYLSPVPTRGMGVSSADFHKPTCISGRSTMEQM